MTIQMLRRSLFAVSASMAFTLSAVAQETSVPQSVETVVVTAVSPVVGTTIDASDVPAALNGITANDIARENSQNITDVLLQRIPGVTISSETGNDYEPDVQFRGYTATPLSGVPEGLAVYQNGVRINEAFGDEVHWDFIPDRRDSKHGRSQQQPGFRAQRPWWCNRYADEKRTSPIRALKQTFRAVPSDGSRTPRNSVSSMGTTLLMLPWSMRATADGGSLRLRRSGASMAILDIRTGVQKFIST